MRETDAGRRFLVVHQLLKIRLKRLFSKPVIYAVRSRQRSSMTDDETFHIFFLRGIAICLEECGFGRDMM